AACRRGDARSGDLRADQARHQGQRQAVAARTARRAARRSPASIMSFITLQDVSKTYGGAPALRNANLTIAAGEIHALMGENGAGKSTLIRILAGVVAPDTATISIDERPVTIAGPAEAHRFGFRFIHQEFNIVPALSVAENMFIGRRYPLRLG